MKTRQWSELVRTTSALLTAVIAAGALTPRRGEAQERASFSVAAGTAVGNGTEPGGVVMAAYTLPLPVSPLAVRVDASYSEWRRTNAQGRISTATANLMYRVPVGPLSSYALAGVGAYAPQGTGTRFGWNGGLGLRADAWRVKPFLEARVHRFPAGGEPGARRRMIPLVVGVSF